MLSGNSFAYLNALTSRTTRKSKLFSIVSLVLFFALSSCQKADDNGDLGGYWKLMQVEYLGTDSIVNHKENSHFMAVQLDLMQL